MAAIQIFAIDKAFEQRSYDLLSAAFDEFPKVDYLIITVPKGKNYHLNSLLNAMVRIIPKTHSTYPDELFVAHRDSILENFKVRAIQQSDLQDVKVMIANQNSPVHGGEKSIRLINEYFESGIDQTTLLKLHIYIVLVSDRIVGVSILRDEEDIEFLRANYDIEKFIHFNAFYRDEHARLIRFYLMPHFLPQTNTFLRESMRQSNKSCLYKVIYGNDSYQEDFSSCMANLLPIMARSHIEYSKGELESFEDNAPSQRVLEEQYNPERKGEPFSLLHINKKLTMHTKLNVANQIVVVGASDVAIAFLKELIYQPHMIFTNLILVSNKRNNNQSSALYKEGDICKLGLSTWVNTVTDETVCNIDRQENTIGLSNGSTISYDNLIITTGLEHTLSTTVNSFYTNICSSNTPPKGDIIVTGINIDSLSFIELHHNDPNVNSITLIENNIRDTVMIPESILDKIEQTIQQSPYNVKLIKSSIESVTTQHSINIKSLTLTTGEVLSNFSQIYGFCDKRIDPTTFRMMNDACLVLDKNLVINSQFSTNDSKIFAAGTCTRYARHYHTEQNSKRENSIAVGQKLAEIFMQNSDLQNKQICRLNPNGDLNQLPDIEDARVCDFGNVPLKQHGYLPNGFEVLCIHHSSEEDSARVISSSSGCGNMRCDIHLDLNGNVMKIFACRNDSEPLCVENLTKLFGLHERTIHNLKFRQDTKPCDLFEFLKTPSLKALFHDRFRNDLLTELYSIASESGLKAKITDTLSDMSLTENKRKEIHEFYSNSEIKTQVEDLITAWLHYNRNTLPMYAQPGVG